MPSRDDGVHGVRRSREWPPLSGDREGVARMTVLHPHGDADFSVVCDGCGRVLDHLGTILCNWGLAWSLLSRHGWVGTRDAAGPHGCPRCMKLAGRLPVGDEVSR